MSSLRRRSAFPAIHPFPSLPQPNNPLRLARHPSHPCSPTQPPGFTPPPRKQNTCSRQGALAPFHSPMYACPTPVCHALLQAFTHLRTRWAEFTLPIYAHHGDADKCTSCSGTKRFVEAAGSRDKTFRCIPGGYHEVSAADPEELLWVGGRALTSRGGHCRQTASKRRRPGFPYWREGKPEGVCGETPPLNGH